MVVSGGGLVLRFPKGLSVFLRDLHKVCCSAACKGGVLFRVFAVDLVTRAAGK